MDAHSLAIAITSKYKVIKRIPFAHKVSDETRALVAKAAVDLESTIKSGNLIVNTQTAVDEIAAGLANNDWVCVKDSIKSVELYG